MWVYDKRRANEAQFVYYGMAMVDASTAAGPVPKGMIEYIFSCLDALGIKDGPAHSELIMRLVYLSFYLSIFLSICSTSLPTYETISRI